MQLDQLKRREFITLVGGAGAVGWQFAASAQPPAMPVIGFLSIATPETWAEYVSAFKHGLGQAGFVEGQNVAIKYRWAGSDYSRLPALAKELVERQVSVIASNGGARAALAAKAATSSIPIVFLFGDGDPVKYRLVESISRPGGNVTGVTMIAGVLEPKRLELLHEIAPKPTAIHILVNPNNAGVLQDIPTVAAAAGKLGLAFEVVQAGTESEIDAAFTTLAREHAQALMVANDGFFTIRRAQIVALAARHAVPAIYPWREYAAAGGLISYGTSIREAYRQEGVYVGQILKGHTPTELPVQQPTKFELVINAKTAKALGLEIPMSLLIRVDEVIE
jgi:putative tryptophan/tyrosine transport system substrate-binding protein